MRAAKQLYQLFSKTRKNPGEYVAINGPWDEFGVIQSSEPKDGRFINLIRGVDKRPGEKPTSQF